jgi:hypothetical protein
MRVNLGNVLDEGLRIGGRGRRMNSKVKDQTKQGETCDIIKTKPVLQAKSRCVLQLVSLDPSL